MSEIIIPKQPQSETGLNSARMRVSGVKNNIKPRAILIARLILSPIRTAIPVISSVMAKRVAAGSDRKVRKGR